MSLGIYSEVEMSEGPNLKSIYHFKIDGPLVLLISPSSPRTIGSIHSTPMTRAQYRSLRRIKTRLVRWLEPQPIGPILLLLIRIVWSIVKGFAEVILAVTGLSLLLLTLPVTLPIALFSGQQDDRRRHITVRNFPCLTCGKLLGERSLELADAAWAHTLEQWRQWEQEHPGVRFRRASRTIDAICPHCGQPHRYDLKSRQFVLDPTQSIDRSDRPG
jgi:hypothetical protein